MCGIVGAVGVERPGVALGAALAALGHRGPDGAGLWLDEERRVALGHTRLALVDLEGGAQPLTARGGDLVLVCNGEVYDFEALRRDLAGRGCQFVTGSDSEVILGLYQVYGTGLFAQLRGEHAFLLYDRRRERLLAARDPFGVKPLYVARVPGGVVFASEVKALVAAGWIRPRLDPVALRDTIAGFYADPVFAGVAAVPPGCFLEVDVATGAVEEHRYFRVDLEPAAPPRSRAEWADAVATELRTAVRLRLRADAPVGCYLSGGVDSAVVTALAAEQSAHPVETFTIAFPGSGLDEAAVARDLAARLGVRHHEVPVDAAALARALAPSTFHAELPASNAHGAAKFLLSAAARRRVKAVLTGEGADEVFLGYDSFRPPYRRPQRRGVGHWLFAAAHRAGLDASRPGARAWGAGAAADPARDGMIAYLRHYRLRVALPAYVLTLLGDRNEMAHAIEGRLPMLDARLWELCRGLPLDLLVGPEQGKLLLREVAGRRLPAAVCDAPKRPFFAPPLSLRAPACGLDRLVAEWLAPALVEDAGVFDPDAVRALVAHAAGGPPPPAALAEPGLARAVTGGGAAAAGAALDADRLLLFVLTVQILHGTLGRGRLAPPPGAAGQPDWEGACAPNAS